LSFAIKKLFRYNFIIAGGDQISFLATAPIALLGKVTFACSCRDKSETLGIEKGEEPSTKLVNITQWVKVPPGQSLASKPVAKSTCKPGNGSMELDGARIQAASQSPEMGILVDER